MFCARVLGLVAEEPVLAIALVWRRDSSCLRHAAKGNRDIFARSASGLGGNEELLKSPSPRLSTTGRPTVATSCVARARIRTPATRCRGSGIENQSRLLNRSSTRRSRCRWSSRARAKLLTAGLPRRCSRMASSRTASSSCIFAQRASSRPMPTRSGAGTTPPVGVNSVANLDPSEFDLFQLETSCWPSFILASMERVLLSGCSLQRIGILLGSIHPFHIVQRCGIGPSSLGESRILSAPSHEQPRQTEVSIMAPRLVIDPVRLVTLHGIFLLDGPWFGPRRRVFYCDDIFDREIGRAHV